MPPRIPFPSPHHALIRRQQTDGPVAIRQPAAQKLVVPGIQDSATPALMREGVDEFGISQNPPLIRGRTAMMAKDTSVDPAGGMEVDAVTNNLQEREELPDGKTFSDGIDAEVRKDTAEPCIL